MLLSILPLSDVLPPISPCEVPLPLTLVIQEFTLISLAILPCEDALAMHLVPFPFTLEVFTVGPVIFTAATDLVFFKFSVIEGAIGKSELASSILLAI
jgi:hypothetical protein